MDKRDLDAPEPRPDAPERIFLQVGEDDDATYSKGGEITWCVDKQFDRDVPYVRADIAAAEMAALRAELATDNAAWARDGQRLRIAESENAALRARAEQAEALLRAAHSQVEDEKLWTAIRDWRAAIDRARSQGAGTTE